MVSSQSLSYALLSLLFPLSSALTSPHPAPTDKSADTSGLLSGTIPIPTAAPPYRYGSEPKNFLFARQETLTCGFFNADPSRPNLCDPSSYCSFGQAQSYFGCCALTSSCFAPRSCQTYNGDGHAGPIITSNNRLVVCGSDAPQCQTTIFPTVDGTLAYKGPYTHFDCVTSAGEVLYLFQQTVGASGGTGGFDSGTVTVTQSPQTVSVVVTPPASSSSMTSDVEEESSTTQEPTGSVGVAASGEAGPSSTTGGAVQARQTAGPGAGLLVLALAAGRALL